MSELIISFLLENEILIRNLWFRFWRYVVYVFFFSFVVYFNIDFDRSFKIKGICLKVMKNLIIIEILLFLMYVRENNVYFNYGLV